MVGDGEKPLNSPRPNAPWMAGARAEAPGAGTAVGSLRSGASKPTRASRPDNERRGEAPTRFPSVLAAPGRAMSP